MLSGTNPSDSTHICEQILLLFNILTVLPVITKHKPMEDLCLLFALLDSQRETIPGDIRLKIFQDVEFIEI